MWRIPRTHHIFNIFVMANLFINTLCSSVCRISLCQWNFVVHCRACLAHSICLDCRSDFYSYSCANVHTCLTINNTHSPKSIFTKDTGEIFFVVSNSIAARCFNCMSTYSVSFFSSQYCYL